MSYPILASTIKVVGIVSHEEAIKIQCSSDYLLLITTIPISEGGGQEFSGKLYEYIGAKKPIVATIPLMSELDKYINNNKLGYTIQYDNIEAIVKTLSDITQFPESFKPFYKPSESFIDSISRKNLTKQLSNIIGSI